MNLKLISRISVRTCGRTMGSFSLPEVLELSLNFDECVKTAVKHIMLGNVIAIPTDTIYGLAADAQNSNAIRQLYNIKSRESSKPIAICVHSVESIALWGQIDHLPGQILRQLLPGPVTIVVKRRSTLNAELNPGIEKVAIRIPKHKFVNHLCSSLRIPIALTSANKSNEMNCISVDEFSSLWPSLGAVFNGGQTGPLRFGSTIVDLSEVGKYRIIREGSHLQKTLKVLHEYGMQEK